MIFLFNKITSYKLVSHIKPIIKDGKFINLEVFYEIKDKTYKISFRDSYLLLPNSLSKLSKAFNPSEYYKGIFPYSFVNESNLNYEGVVPDYVYFDKEKVTSPSEDEYLEYKQSFINNNKQWNLLDESSKYSVPKDLLQGLICPKE